MVKIKRVRTIDAVVMGWRPGKEEGTVGSLILGLYDRRRRCARSATRRASAPRRSASCRRRLAPYETGKRGMGEPSRWANERELEWIELRPELVVEVTFDHTSNGRIRHGAKIARWREDKAAAGVPDRAAGPVAVTPRSRPPPLVDAGDAPLARVRLRLQLLGGGAPELEAVEALARLSISCWCMRPQSSSGVRAWSSASPLSDSSYSTRAGTRA